MNTLSTMKSNESLQLKVASQLGTDPLLKDAEIVVDTYSREVIVKGAVNKFFKKALVCTVVKEVTGIKNITDCIAVVLSNPAAVSDIEIANAILEKFDKNFGNSYKNIEVNVKNGAVTLSGNLKWKYQKLLATECISYIEGIVSIQNNISTVAVPEPDISEKDILAAIYRDDSITSDITVDLNGRKVIISGEVTTAFRKKLVEKLVRDVPGVQEIDNQIQIVKK